MSSGEIDSSLHLEMNFFISSAKCVWFMVEFKMLDTEAVDVFG